jgi:hypothetical protein
VKVWSHAWHLLGFTSGLDTLVLTMLSGLVASILRGKMFHRCVEQRFLDFPSASSPPLPV